MKLNNFLALKAIVSSVFGVIFVLVPAAAMSFFGATLDPGGLLMTRVVGACLIGIGLICWLDRNAAHDALKGITLALFVGDSVGFLVILAGQITGLMNVLGWTIVAIWLIFAVGLGYFRFVNHGGSLRASLG